MKSNVKLNSFVKYIMPRIVSKIVSSLDFERIRTDEIYLNARFSLCSVKLFFFTVMSRRNRAELKFRQVPLSRFKKFSRKSSMLRLECDQVIAELITQLKIRYSIR